MPERVAADTGADDVDVATELGGLTSLGFFTPRGHPEHDRAKRLDEHLAPVRATARSALSSASPRVRADGLKEAWRLVDVAAETLDHERWFRGVTTREWATRHVAHVRRGTERARKHKP